MNYQNLHCILKIRTYHVTNPNNIAWEPKTHFDWEKSKEIVIIINSYMIIVIKIHLLVIYNSHASNFFSVTWDNDSFGTSQIWSISTSCNKYFQKSFKLCQFFERFFKNLKTSRAFQSFWAMGTLTNSK